MPGDAIKSLIALNYRAFVETPQRPPPSHGGFQNAPPDTNSKSSHIHIQHPGRRASIHVTAKPAGYNYYGQCNYQPMASSTLASVIRTVSNIKFGRSLDESINAMFTLFKHTCKKFRVPDNEQLDLLSYALTGPARTHFPSNRHNLPTTQKLKHH